MKSTFAMMCKSDLRKAYVRDKTKNAGTGPALLST